MTAAITDDGWFTERAREFEQMDREQLLNQARKWAFDAQQFKLREIRAQGWADSFTADARQALDRVQALVNVRRKTLPMGDLIEALKGETS